MTPNQKIIHNVLKKFRGDRTQMEMSVLMGYNYNYYNKIEKCTKKISWSEFCKLASLQGYDLHSFFARYLSFMQMKFEHESSSVILNQFLVINNLSLESLSKKREFQVHDVTLKRWLRAKDLSLEVMLGVFSLEPEFKENFLGLFNLEQQWNGDIYYQFLTSEILKKYQYEYIAFHPWALSIIAYFKVHTQEKYNKSTIEKMSESLQILSSVLTPAIREMLNLKLLTVREGYVVPEDKYIDFTQAPLTLILRQTQYWTSKLNARLIESANNTPKRKGIVHFSDLRVDAISDESFEKIQKIQLETSAKIVDVLKHQKGDLTQILCYCAYLFNPGINHKEEKLEQKWQKQNS